MLNWWKYLAAGLVIVLGASLSAPLRAVEAENASDTFYAAIRSNDLTRLGTMLKQGADVNVKDRTGATPLMYTASAGSIDAMKLLLDHRADPNLTNSAGSTALMWSVTDIAKVRLLLDHKADVSAVSKLGRTAVMLAAMSDPSVEIVRLLVRAGADVKVVDSMKTTALNAAAVGNDIETIRLLTDAGVDVNAADFAGFTPLINAAWRGNPAAARLLIAKGANVNAVSGDGSFQKVKAGTIALGNWTPLLVAASDGPADLVKLLLDAGANVNARDVRGMTPLMLAAATDRQNPEVVGTLIAKGADVNAKSLVGETALDWARKIGAPSGIDALKRAGAMETPVSTVSVPPAAPSELKTSVAKSVSLLEKTSTSFAAAGGCASCHSHNILELTTATARRKGIAVDDKTVPARQTLTKAPFFSQAMLLERMDGPGAPDIANYALLGFASAGYTPDRATDAMVVNVMAQQNRDGHWNHGGIARPPIEDGVIYGTALGIRALKVFGPPGRSAEVNERVARAKAWLTAAKATTNEDRNMQLLGLQWAGAEAAVKSRFAKAILAAQRSDGGWSQTADLASDAYATGQSLFALAEAGGITPDNASYQKGVKYLLATQRADGSWYVRSRSPKFQPYFESGFPYAHDQWISAMATGWGAAALALAVN